MQNPAQATDADVKTQLEEQDRAIQLQYDRIYKMVEEGKNPAFLKIEYKRAVELISAKYQILLAVVEQQKERLGLEEHQKRQQALKDQYKEDIVLLAVSIDEATGQTETPGTPAPKQ